MPTIDRSVTTYIRRKRAELLTTFSKWNPDKRVEGPRSQSNIPYTEMKLATGFTSFDSEPAPINNNLTLSDIATFDSNDNTWYLDIPSTTIAANQILTIIKDDQLSLRSGEEFINNGIIIITGVIYNDYGTIDNNGTININGTINNYSTFINNGTITNNYGGAIDNYTGGIITNNDTINNNGTITNDSGTINNIGTITNDGVIGNIQGGSITNNDIFTNNGTIYNPLTDTGCGIGTITGTITGTGTIVDGCPSAPA